MAEEIDYVDGDGVLSTRSPRGAGRRVSKKVPKKAVRMSKVVRTEGSEGIYRGEALPQLLRNRMRVALSQTLNNSNQEMFDWLANIVEVKVNLSKNNPAFAAFDAVYNPNGWVFDGARLTRKPRSITSATTLEERRGHQFAAMFSEATYGEQEFFPDEAMNIEAMRYPSARHLFFLAETVAHIEGWVSEESVAATITIDDYRPNHGISILRVDESIIDRFNDSRWSDFNFGISRPHYDECHSVGDRQVEQLELLHTELSPQTIIPLTIQTILGGAEEISKYILSIVGSRVSCMNSSRNRNRDQKHQMRSMVNIAIEGIHWNTERREEIDHLIVRGDLTRRELLSAYLHQEDDSDNRVHPLKSNLTNSAEVQPYTFSDLDGFSEGIVVGDLALACTGLDLQSMLMAHAAETRETPAQMRATAIYNAAQYKRQEFNTAFDRAVRLRRELLEAELEVHKMRAVCDAYERDLAGVIDRLEARLSEMELLEDVQLSPGLKFMVTTKDMYAEPHNDEDDDTDEGETPLPKYNLSHRRYVGKYQIIFDPLEGTMYARNIAAVMVVEGGRDCGSKKAGRSLHAAGHACAAFHPHASIVGDYSSTEVCMGSYDTDVGRTLRRVESSQIEDVVLGQLRTFLLFLQTYSLNDTYVRSLIGAMPETKPTEERALGVTAWQAINGDEKFPATQGFVFDSQIGPRRVATKYVVDNSMFLRPALINREPKSILERYWPYTTKEMAIPYTWLLNSSDPAVMALKAEQEQRERDERLALAKRREEERERRMNASAARRLTTLEQIEIRRANAIAAERMASGELNGEFGLNENEAVLEANDPARRSPTLAESSFHILAPTPAFEAADSDATSTDPYEGVC